MDIIDIFDSSFDICDGFDSAVLTSALQPDGKIVVGGYFNHYNKYECNKVVRINSDGSYDHTFNSEANIGKHGYVWTINLQSDGKILVGGSFSTLDNRGPYSIVRLNYDGSIDKTFAIGTGFSGGVKAITILPDNKILVGGAYASINGIKKCFISRLNSDGSLDGSFNVVDGFSKNLYHGVVSTIALQDDGKIILGGLFRSFNDFICTNIIRLTSDGSIDKSFNPQLSKQNNVTLIKIQKDSKIIVGFGYNESMDGDGLGRNYILRLNFDGTIDNSFKIGKAFDSHLIRDIYILPNEKIIIGGWFILFGENLRKNLAVINKDGSIDSSHNIGTGLNRAVTTISVQSNSQIIVGGYFTSYNGGKINNLARLKETILYIDTHDVFLIKFDSEKLKIIINENINVIGKRVEIYDDFGNIVYFSNIVLNNPNSFLIDRNSLNNEVYYLLLHDKKKYIYSQKIILEK